MRKSLALLMFLSAPLGLIAGAGFGAAQAAGPVSSRVAQRATASARTTTAAAATKPSALFQKSASELLTLSAAALAQTSSYQFSGPASVAAAPTRGKKRTPAALDVSGAFQKPSQNYSKVTLKSKTAEATAETYSDGKDAYVRVSTAKKAGTWTRSNQPVGIQGNPFAALQLASNTISTVTLGPDTTLNGKQYITLTAVLNEEAARQLLGGLLAAAGYDISTPTGASGKAEASLTYYIDPKTFLAEASHFSGTQAVTLSSGSTLKVTGTGDLALKGVNQPVTFPDVSGAVQRQP